MDITALGKIALGVLGTAVARDVIVRPKEVAAAARTYADASGKPLLNLGAGGISLRAMVLGDRLWGDVNLDANARPGTPSAGTVVWGNYYSLPWPDNHFGAVVAVNALETLERPDLALREWHRVADKVLVCVPRWWNPQSWLSRWYIDEDVRKAWPVWTERNEVILLQCPTSRGYAPGKCPTPPTLGPRPHPTMTSTTKPSSPSPRRPPLPSPLPQTAETQDTESSRPVSTLAVLSGFDPAKR